MAVVPGARDVEGTEALVAEARRRTGGRVMRLMTSDAYPAYEAAILHAYGQEVEPPRTGKPGRPKATREVPPEGLTYATVEKVRRKGRAVEILTRGVSSNGAENWNKGLRAAFLIGGRPVGIGSPARSKDSQAYDAGSVARYRNTVRRLTPRAVAISCNERRHYMRFGCGSEQPCPGIRRDQGFWLGM